MTLLVAAPPAGGQACYTGGMRGVVIYIDESGTLPDPADTVVVVAAVGTVSPHVIEMIFRRVKKKAAFKKPTGEIKYYTAGEKTKELFFEFLAKEDVTICVLVVDKMGRKISDTPEHYGALCLLLLEDLMRDISMIREICFDRHFSKQADMDVFDDVVRTLVGPAIPIRHVDSMKDKRVNVADMVAGAMLASETGREARFAAILKPKIRRVRRIGWRAVKERLLATKKLA